MNKRIVLWGVLVVLLIFSLPEIVERWKTETDNHTYEIAVPFEEIRELTTNKNITIDHAIQSLKTAGLTAITLKPLTLNEIEYSDSNTIYDKKAIEKIQEHNLQLVLRLNNNAPSLPHNINHLIVDSIIDNKTDAMSNILFTGEEVIGYPDITEMNDLTSKLHNAGFNFYTIEFSNQLGLQQVVKNTNYDVIRLHSIHLDDNTLQQNIHRAVRAVKERNIRSIFFHIQATDNPINNLENASAFIEGIHNKMPSTFHTGVPKPFQSIEITTMEKIIVLITGILFTYIAIGSLQKKWIQIFSGLAIFFLALLYLFSDQIILLQLFGLVIAITTPTYAVLSCINRETGSIKDISLKYLKAILINFIGIFIIVGLYNGNAFITGNEVFRGVKVLYILPLLIVGFLLFYKLGFQLIKDNGQSILQANVKYWHLLIIILFGAVFFYYISRTGNVGTVSEIELTVRNMLEELLYVRPRTKEFLIGFPLFILGLYIMHEHNRIGKILLIPGAIGFISMMNTFTHFHIPLYISLLRSVYSIILGYIIGILLIYLYKFSIRYITQAFKRRLS